MREVSSYEKFIALLEGHKIAATDQYFAARPELPDTLDNRKLFDAGFDRAWRKFDELQRMQPKSNNQVAERGE